jgi:GTP-binding protein
VADVGLVGFPSAGKSSLISVLSAARPKIADYPFTTLVPNLGVVAAGTDSYVVADVPGLIPGAATGKGLGLQFLRHIERCAVLAHVVDCATLETDRDPVSDIDAIEAELSAYGGLEDKPRIVVLNKIDVPDARDLAEIVRSDVAARGWPVYEVSAVTHEGLRELTFGLAALVAEHRAAQPPVEPGRIVLRPRAVNDTGFILEELPDGSWSVTGEKPLRWVVQTNFDNEEAVGYLADRLARLGIEEALTKRGAVPGCLVRIGSFEFDWQPAVYAGAQFTPGQRGTDYRLEETSGRTTAAERLAARKARRVPYENRPASEANPDASPEDDVDFEADDDLESDADFEADDLD